MALLTKILLFLILLLPLEVCAKGIEINEPVFPKTKMGVVKKQVELPNKEKITVVTQQNPFCEFEYNVLCIFNINGEEVRREVHFNKSRQELTDKEILDKIQEVYDRVVYEHSDEYRLKQIDERLKEIEKIEAEKQRLIKEKEELKRDEKTNFFIGK